MTAAELEVLVTAAELEELLVEVATGNWQEQALLTLATLPAQLPK